MRSKTFTVYIYLFFIDFLIADDRRINFNKRKFICKDGWSTLYRYVCNGIKNCEDGSDELRCDTRVCRNNEFRCNSGQCILKEDDCDGLANCLDRSDEINCDCSFIYKNPFTCKNGECVRYEDVCDGNEHCFDGSDEDNCAIRICKGEDEFRCSSGQCIPADLTCDGTNDCGDKSDESSCKGIYKAWINNQHENKEVKSGSNLKLTCNISPFDPLYVDWYHNDTIVDYESSRIDKIGIKNKDSNVYINELFIKNVISSDSGQYICHAYNYDPTGITVQVI